MWIAYDPALAKTCWIALVFSTFDQAGFFRITSVTLTSDDTILLTLTSFGAVWSNPSLPSTVVIVVIIPAATVAERNTLVITEHIIIITLTALCA